MPQSIDREIIALMEKQDAFLALSTKGDVFATAEVMRIEAELNRLLGLTGTVDAYDSRIDLYTLLAAH